MTTQTDTEQEHALLPCPFCGGANIEIQTSTPDREDTPTHLMCADCGAAGPWSYERGGSYTVAAAFWNARAALQSQDREEIMEMALCESRRLVLRVGQAYRFVPMKGCKTCEEMKAEHDEAYSIDHARRVEGENDA